jgi:carotenoid cleavage dioxygenase
MARPLPDDQPFLSGNFAPWPMEGEIHDCEVVGEIPRELAGTYYRNGANPQFAPRGRYHWFDGDGMIHAFRFEDGRVSYRNRWVRTERFELERAAGDSLFGSLTDMGASDERVQGRSANAANTNIVWHGGRLLALWEAGLPHALDPRTLETLGPFDYDGALTRPMDPELAQGLGLDAPGGEVPGIMTAHPKVDPETGELLFFGYSPFPPFLVYYCVDAGGRLTRRVPLDPPFASMQHDFVATRNHVVFPVFPAVFDLALIEQTGSPLGWQPERGAHLGVMPRSGGADDVVWIETDPCYVFHFMNAWEDGGRIVTEVARYPVLPLFGYDAGEYASLHRWTIDLAAGSVKSEPLDDATIEFPRLDERRAGLPYRHGYAAAMLPGSGLEPAQLRFDTIVHYDLARGRRRAHRLRPGSATGEPVFVPRSPQAEEGDGFLLAAVYRGDENRSDLLVLDARDVEAEPLARVRLPHRVPFGFHGNWKPA